MGKPLPGVYGAIVDDDGEELEAGELGRLVVRPGWPAMLRTVWRNEPKFHEYFKIPGWYFSGDNAWKTKTVISGLLAGLMTLSIHQATELAHLKSSQL
jgi:acyl-coenzyme A synthetase/AMP-(fatty) acid ligase